MPVRAIKGLLIDLDGVLYVSESVVPGAREALQQIHEMEQPIRFLTNTTTRTASSVIEKLDGLGFTVHAEDVFTPVTATRQFLEQQDTKPRIQLVVRDSVATEFTDFPLDDAQADYVIVGDIGAAWSYPLMNTIFRNLHRGAELIAMHRNRFFQTGEGLRMDIGAFVVGLEYVSGKPARIIGKPSPDFFELALASLGCAAPDVLMVGDDIESDVGGAQAAGLKGVLVKTGKYREGCIEHTGITPDAVLNSIAELPDYVSRYNTGGK